MVPSSWNPTEGSRLQCSYRHFRHGLHYGWTVYDEATVSWLIWVRLDDKDLCSPWNTNSLKLARWLQTCAVTELQISLVRACQPSCDDIKCKWGSNLADPRYVIIRSCKTANSLWMFIVSFLPSASTDSSECAWPDRARRIRCNHERYWCSWPTSQKLEVRSDERVLIKTAPSYS